MLATLEATAQAGMRRHFVKRTVARGKRSRGERPDGDYRFGDFVRGLFADPKHRSPGDRGSET